METDSTIGSNINIIPVNHNITGTCGECGGPIISPIMWSSTDPSETPPEWCLRCNKSPKKEIIPAYGPIRQMQ